jgi:hypothetical protein
MANSFGVTSNFKKAGTISAKTLPIKTVALTLKPRKYATQRIPKT